MTGEKDLDAVYSLELDWEVILELRGRRRHEVSDNLWEQIKPLLPNHRRSNDDRPLPMRFYILPKPVSMPGAA